MSNTYIGTAPTPPKEEKKRRDPVFYWLGCAFLSFFIFPSFALDYGLFDSMPEEIWDAMGWSSFNIAWTWFLLPLVLLVRPRLPSHKTDRKRHKFDITWSIICISYTIISSWLTGHSLGYATVSLFLALSAVITYGYSRLEYLGGDVFVIGSLIAIIELIGLFIIYPSIAIFVPMFYDDMGNFVLWQFVDILSQSQITRIIINSMCLGTTVGVLATFFGLVFAIYSTRIAVRSAFITRVFSILPIVTPPFVVGLGVTLMLGRSGYITEFMADWFGLEQTNWLYGFTGITIAQVLAFAPVSFMIIDGAMKSLHPSLEEASYTLRANRYQTFFNVVLPLLKPALANSFLIIFVQSLADFANPLVLGGSFDVLATQIYFYIAGSQLDYASASTLGGVLLIFSLLIFCIQYAWIGQRSYVTISGKAYRGDVQPLPESLRLFVIISLYAWMAFNVLLYGSIVFGSFTVNWGVDYSLTFDNYLHLFGQGFDEGAWPSLISTLCYAGLAAPLTAAFGLLIAYIVVRQEFHGKKVVEFATMLCFAVPGTVAGVSYILAFNDAPVYITGTAAIVVVSMVMRDVPVGIRAGIAGLGQLDKSLDEASLSLRADSWNTIKNIIIPLLRPAILSALIYSFVRAMTTVSAIIFLVTPETRVATAYILNRVEDGEYGIAIAYGSLLIFVMLGIIFLFDFLIGEARVSRSKSNQQD